MEEKLITLFRRVTIKHRTIIQRFLDDYGLYIGQPRYLFILEANPGITLRDMVEKLELTKESVSVTLKRLERNGYVSKIVSKDDKRAKLLYLTDEGKNVISKFRHRFDELDNQLFESLSDKDQEKLKEYFLVILDKLAEGERK